MSKWIILSDNHKETGILYHIYDLHKDADKFLHLGDSEFSYNDTELSLYQRVKGNCAFYTHGHLYQVNQTRMKLAEKAKELGCLFAFYGHTHVAKYEQIGGIHVINPGSISQSRSQIEETFAELVYKDHENTIILNFRNRENQVIETVKIEY